MDIAGLVVTFVSIVVAVWIGSKFGAKTAVRTILGMDETRSIQRAMKHFENFMESLDEFGKSPEMKALAHDFGQMYQRVGVMFGLSKDAEKKKEEKEYG